MPEHLTKSPGKRLRFVTNGECWAEVDLRAEHWATLQREARRAKMKVAVFIAKIICDYAERMIAESKARDDALTNLVRQAERLDLPY